MKVLCHGNLGSKVPEDIRGENFSEHTYFPVKVGKAYQVYAMIQVARSPLVQFLVFEFGSSHFCPADLFTVVDSRLPPCWGYTEWKRENFHCRIWGYPEILNYSHHEGLTDGRPEDLAIFARVKNEIDNTFLDENESTILSELLKVNGIRADITKIHVAERENGRVSRIVRFTPSQLMDLPSGIEDKTVSGTIEGDYPVECVLLTKGGIVYGMEVYYLDELPPPKVY